MALQSLSDVKKEITLKKGEFEQFIANTKDKLSAFDIDFGNLSHLKQISLKWTNTFQNRKTN